jgi:hypothetical protein
LLLRCAGCRYQVSLTSGTILHNTKTPLTAWFWAAYFTCSYKDRALVIQQEMALLDMFLLEFLIEFGGVERFKPVFPGEQLYLGFRQRALGVPVVSYNFADLAATRVRALVRDDIVRLNKLVALGAPPLPVLPPMFVSRVTHASSEPSWLSRVFGTSPASHDIVRTLFEIRNSPAVRSFRKWAERCMELLASTDIGSRKRASAAYDKLTTLALEDDISLEDFGKGVLNVAKDCRRAMCSGFSARW